MSKTRSVKFVCTQCQTPVYRVTSGSNLLTKHCSWCVKQKAKPLPDATQGEGTTRPYTPAVAMQTFDPVKDCEKTIQYYLKLLHIVEFKLLEHYRTPEQCHFQELWDQAKQELEGQ